MRERTLASRENFLHTQRERLLKLRAALADSVASVAQVWRESPSECSPCTQHPADGGSDACDRYFALGLISHEQNALSQIDEALWRIEHGTYGICELSGKPIPRARLEAIPFARFRVEQQTLVERERRAIHAGRRSVEAFA